MEGGASLTLTATQLLIRALVFAAEKHHIQRRKDEELEIGNGKESGNTWNWIVMCEILGDAKSQKRREILRPCELETKAGLGVFGKVAGGGW